jgi:uncharacterized protein YbaR (Trm112 family)
MDDSLLELVVCPVTRSKLRKEGEWLVSSEGGLKYPTKEGVPVLLPEAAVLPEGFKTLEEFRASLKKVRET